MTESSCYVSGNATETQDTDFNVIFMGKILSRWLPISLQPMSGADEEPWGAMAASHCHSG
jgi:hypothetical protein